MDNFNPPSLAQGNPDSPPLQKKEEKSSAGAKELNVIDLDRVNKMTGVFLSAARALCHLFYWMS